MKFKLIALFTVLFTAAFFCTVNAQVKNFSSEKDSLKTLKQTLIDQNKKLKDEVDSLKNYSARLDKEITKAKSGLNELKKEYLHKKYGKEIGDRVLAGRVWKGMTEQMMKDGWGKPDKTNTNKHKWGVFTQWYYGDITYFFKNGKLIDWEEKTKK